MGNENAVPDGRSRDAAVLDSILKDAVLANAVMRLSVMQPSGLMVASDVLLGLALVVTAVLGWPPGERNVPATVVIPLVLGSAWLVRFFDDLVLRVRTGRVLREIESARTGTKSPAVAPT